MVVWEISVRLGEKPVRFEPQFFEHHRCGDSARPVSAVISETHSAFHLNAAAEKISVVFRNIGFCDFSARAFAFCFGSASERFDFIAEHRLFAHAQLEPVVFGRVMARGYNHSAVRREIEYGKIEHRR